MKSENKNQKEKRKKAPFKKVSPLVEQKIEEEERGKGNFMPEETDKGKSAKKYEEMEKVDNSAEDEKIEESAPPRTPEEKIADLTSQLQRIAAEFANYKKKNAREFDRGRQFGAVEILERLAPVFESFECAVSGEYDENSCVVTEGFEKIHGQMMENLKSAGLKIIEPKKGDPLNPNIHEVMFVEETDQAPNDSIFATFAKGYSYKDKLIRPAKVQVAKSPKDN